MIQRMLHVPVMMKGNAVKFLERVGDFAVGSGKARIHRNTLHLGGVVPSDVDTGTLFDIAEVECVRRAALVGNHRWLHVANKSPLRLPEEGMRLNVGGASSRSKTLRLILDQELADQRFAGAVTRLAILAIHPAAYDLKGCVGTYFEICCAPACSGNCTSSRRILPKVPFRFLPLNGVVP